MATPGPARPKAPHGAKVFIVSPKNGAHVGQDVLVKFGVKGIKCNRKEDIQRCVEEMIAHPGPVVVDFLCEANEHVYPMVASGKALHEMELGVIGQPRPAQVHAARDLGTLA